MINLNSKLFLLFLVLLLLPITSAITGQQGTEIPIKHEVRVNGAIQPGVVCNITINYPNQTTLVDFQPMTNQNSYYNYTLSSSQTQTKGLYDYCITCMSASGLNNTECFDLLINLGGVEPSTSRTTAISLLIILFFALSIVFFIAFMLNQHMVMKWSMLLFATLFLLAAINFLFISVQDEIVNPRVENFLSGFTAISYYIYWFIGALLAILWLISLATTILSRREFAKQEKYGS